MTDNFKKNLKKDSDLVKQELEKDVEFVRDLADSARKRISERNVELTGYLQEKFDAWQQQTEKLKKQTETFLQTHKLKK